MAGRLISEYFDAGPAASRPATPDIAAGTVSQYFATDTGVLSLYLAGSGWVDVNAGVATPAVIQSKIITTSDAAAGITLDAAPAENRMLVSMVMAGTSSSPLGVNTGAGWRGLISDTTAPDFTCAYRFTNSSSEPALQDPWSSTDTAVIAMWEIANAAAFYTPFNADLDGSFTSGNITPLSDVLRLIQPGLLVGFTARRSTSLPSSITGATPGATVSATGLAGQIFETDITALSTPSIGITYSGAEATRRGYVIVR